MISGIVKGKKVDLRKKCFIKDPDTGRTYSFSPKELKVWDLYKEGKSKVSAYFSVFGSKGTEAYTIFKRKKFQLLEKMEEEKSKNLWEKYKELSPKALDLQVKLMNDKSVKDELRNQIADKIQDRAGFSPTIKNATLRLNANIESPLKIKSPDELAKLFEDNAKAIKQLESEVRKRERIKIGYEEKKADNI